MDFLKVTAYGLALTFWSVLSAASFPYTPASKPRSVCYAVFMIHSTVKRNKILVYLLCRLGLISRFPIIHPCKLNGSLILNKGTSNDMFLLSIEVFTINDVDPPPPSRICESECFRNGIERNIGMVFMRYENSP